MRTVSSINYSFVAHDEEEDFEMVNFDHVKKYLAQREL
jgi:hypothetical protein